VLGGNVTAGPVLSLATTVFGRSARPVSRVGARVGDGVYVTGVLGGARAALVAWQRGALPSPAARVAFARPYPRLVAGRWLAGLGATAMIDVSDGLGGDAGHLAAASGVGLEIDLGRVPVHPAVLARAVHGEQPAAVFAATGGEDYELLVTLPEGAVDPVGAEPAAGVSLTRIGAVVAGEGARFLLDGREVPLAGFVHG
jgi:thiamine-monophosphate kinase